MKSSVVIFIGVRLAQWLMQLPLITANHVRSLELACGEVFGYYAV